MLAVRLDISPAGCGGGGDRSESLRQAKKKEEENSLALQFLSLPHLPSPPPLPGGSDQRLHLFYEVTANHVLVAGDPQRVGHGFSVESGVEDHDGAVYATVQEVLGKLLQVGDWGKKAKR